MEFAHFRAGEMTYLAAGERFTGRPGDAVFVNGGVPHSELAPGSRRCVEGSLACHPKMLCGERGSALWTRYFRHLLSPGACQVVYCRRDGTAWEREVCARVREAWEAVPDETEFFEETCRSNLTRTCLIVQTHATPAQTSEQSVTLLRNVDRMKDMIRVVEEHFAEELTTDQIASAGGVSQREAQREFREVVGESPMAYLTNHRLFVASQRLRSTDASIGEIARACGFGSQSYFTKRFRALRALPERASGEGVTYESPRQGSLM